MLSLSYLDDKDERNFDCLFSAQISLRVRLYSAYGCLFGRDTRMMCRISNIHTSEYHLCRLSFCHSNDCRLVRELLGFARVRTSKHTAF